MTGFAQEHDGATVRYLTRKDVIRCCDNVDIVETVADALRAHAKGNTILPEEGYMGWQTPDGFSARSIAMPGGIAYDDRQIYGVKIINGSLGNTARGLARSQGITMMFDEETARPKVIMEAAYISALRTAAVTMATAQVAGKTNMGVAAIVGCGTIAKAHLELLAKDGLGLKEIRLYDLDPNQANAFARAVEETPFAGSVQATVTDSVRECVEGADLVITTTISTESYMPIAWLSPGAVVAHVSLDDVMPDVVEGCDLLVVDDWSLVSHDNRRLLGRMYRQGALRGPDGASHPDAPTNTGRRVDGTIGELLTGALPGRKSDSDIVLSNPFGMSVLDVAVADKVLQAAIDAEIGQTLEI